MKGKKTGYVGNVLFLALCISAFVLGMKAVPKAVCYNMAGENAIKEIREIETVSEMDLTPQYTEVQLLPSLEKYTLVSIKGKIYVKNEEECLYLVKTNLRDFPSEDVIALQNGIEIEGKEMLVEFIEYMES